jgi:hypothetical protein
MPKTRIEHGHVVYPAPDRMLLFLYGGKRGNWETLQMELLLAVRNASLEIEIVQIGPDDPYFQFQSVQADACLMFFNPTSAVYPWMTLEGILRDTLGASHVTYEQRGKH